MDIFEWQVGFKCRSYLCERDWCLLSRRNPKKIVPVDIYSLISVFEGISVAAAKSQVAKWFGLKLGEFESKGVRPSTREEGSEKRDPCSAGPIQECPNAAISEYEHKSMNEIERSTALENLLSNLRLDRSVALTAPLVMDNEVWVDYTLNLEAA